MIKPATSYLWVYDWEELRVVVAHSGAEKTTASSVLVNDSIHIELTGDESLLKLRYFRDQLIDGVCERSDSEFEDFIIKGRNINGINKETVSFTSESDPSDGDWVGFSNAGESGEDFIP